LLMLGNQVELWETALAVMKLGGVIVPATTMLGPADLDDRIERGEIRFVVARSEDASKFGNLDPSIVAVSVGDAPAGWRAYAEASGAPVAFEPAGPTRTDDPLLLYFTSGTT